MKSVTTLFIIFLFGLNLAVASDEILFNTKLQRSVLDMSTDPNLKYWEKETPISDLCFKNATVNEALNEILNYMDQGLLFDSDTESYEDSRIVNSEIIITIFNGKMMDDGLSEDEATSEHIVSKCNF